MAISVTMLVVQEKQRSQELLLAIFEFLVYNINIKSSFQQSNVTSYIGSYHLPIKVSL